VRSSGLLRGGNGTFQEKECEEARPAKLHPDDSDRN
jgi:hypothetical protein